METETERRAENQSATRGGDPIPPLRPDDHSAAHPAQETPVEARQGFLGRPVLKVLIAGLVLAVLAWIVVALLVS
ncbi:hypothetical protein [Bosea sp. BIWAKO-01]|uniref:hypothetical protein n=1 Tax=Bosea sp. BIWAKO-01 TaxID=506668 RepID=UPI000853B5CD|nr:hypothetical protein [Bosea sp. BIWAKO-01]GAU85392.1 hypothetical protein BIWAKO_05339 [Bosea sp. BIWAKO-01]